MMEFYELWDTESGNLINTYNTEEAALAIVRDLIALNGFSYAEFLALGRQSSSGEIEMVAEGSALVARAGSIDSAELAGPR